jgi:hypothetical protein
MKTPSKDNLEKILNSTRPTNKTQVKSFLGLTGFFQVYVPNYSEITAPLTDLLKKNHPNKVIWGKSQEDSFQKLKAYLLGGPILKLPLWDQEFILRTDASNYAIAGVLMQEHDGVLHPVAFASKKLSDREFLYPISEKEALSVVWSIQRFTKFLYGKKFIVETDHKPLTILKLSDSVNPRLQRWSISLQPFNFSVRVIPGKDNIGADFFSRHFDEVAVRSGFSLKSVEQVRYT